MSVRGALSLLPALALPLLAAGARAADPLPEAGVAPMVPAAPDPAIAAVVETFRAAIVAKDRDRLLALFVPGATWIGVYGDASLARGQRQHPERGKAYPGTPAGFIDALRASPQRFEETFHHVVVAGDADIAAVTFDYEMRKDGVPANRGEESWHLVRTAEGWRICSVVYSVNLAP